MKQYLKFITVLSISILVVACANDVEDICRFTNDSQKAVPDIVLQERDPRLPEVVTKKIEFGTNIRTKSGANGEIIGNSDVLLGYSYSIGNSIMGDYDNVGAPIVDINKVKGISSEYIVPKQLLGNFTRSFAFSDFDRYEYNSTVTKKVTSGFDIKIKLFSFGRKKTTTEVFTSIINNSKNVVYGELNLDIRNSSFTLQTAEGARKLYARECLSNTFMRNLYSTPLGDILNTYGDFVLTGYYTGGKAFGLYAGEAKDGSDIEKKEKDMTKDINASFAWKSNSTSGNLNFGNSNSSSTTVTYNTQEAEFYIRTYGGIQSGQAMTAALPLKSLNLDLSSWLNSLSDCNTHTIVDVQDQGLYPLSYFVLEENFKRRFDDSFNGVLEKRTKLITPYIEIVRVYVRATSSGEALYDVAAVLNTRQGDKIILSNGQASLTSDVALRANANDATFLQKAKIIAGEKMKFYSLRITTNTRTMLNPILRTPLIVNFDGFDETKMYRYKNPKTGIEYIYDTVKRIAFSHLVDPIDEDWILDDYGIRDWVESLPVRSISMASLANSYKIVGL